MGKKIDKEHENKKPGEVVINPRRDKDQPVQNDKVEYQNNGQGNEPELLNHGR